MPSSRPHLPRWLYSELLIEAGHRCAIPTCKGWPVQIAHIVKRSVSRDDTFDNLIALCPRCHDLYDRYRAMSTREMRAYKRNLEVLGEQSGNIRRRLSDLPIWQLLELYGHPWPPAKQIRRIGHMQIAPLGVGKTEIITRMMMIYDRHKIGYATGH
ncbi:HNH endonuclease signature motif containing protein [Actinoplanes sp. NPDC049548]|uniref:HNH endonuclease n=1 Tax=Actinoplanes sp. NPDC049548 TaxID=3155152 RepID=UPI00341657B4